MLSVRVLGWGLLLGLAGSISPLRAQGAQAPQEPETLQVTSRLVVLDVVVLDRAGKPVTNLDQSKFSIYEDKAPQTIKNFDPPTGHAMPRGSASEAVVHSAADLPKIGTAPVNILVFDELLAAQSEGCFIPAFRPKYLREIIEAFVSFEEQDLPSAIFP